VFQLNKVAAGSVTLILRPIRIQNAALLAIEAITAEAASD
jgi:hypothetical protein